ncbi:hypothetical protein N7G274_007293 [Stereocaulon virgatum]|uniref:Integral membrane protein n=1 Tax=Stereocaulon virgatum TaxID=373712 RepID=A0ABR4A1Z1_9LECA
MATSVGSKYRGPWFSYPTRNELIAAATVLPALACVAVVLRFTVRARQKAGIRVDDWLTLPAALHFLGMCIAVLKGIADRSVGYPSPPENNLSPGLATPNEVSIAKASRTKVT